MQATKRRIEQMAHMSCADYTARHPHPVLVAVEIAAGVPQRVTSDADTKEKERSNMRRTAPAGRIRKKPAVELRQETMENVTDIEPGKDVDPAMLQDRPISRPYFVELRKVITDYPGKVIIGRQQPCDVVVNDFTVSTRHAAFEYHHHHNVFMLTDLGSTNGTSVEGTLLRPNHPMVIRSHSEISFGRIRLRFLTAPHFYYWLLARETPSP